MVSQAVVLSGLMRLKNEFQNMARYRIMRGRLCGGHRFVAEF